ncbi:serine palmitoyltransferase small subunit A-like [Dermatophagoides pteronyssinus]
MSSLLKHSMDRLKHWYFVYELRTSLYMLEPWEKKLFNTVMLTITASCCYFTYRFLPSYAHALFEYFGII